MVDRGESRFDDIGYWSEVKLEIVREYAHAYSTILAKKHLHHVYIDAFAGAGLHLSRATERFVHGSPLNALRIEPPFREFYFIDLDGEKVEALRELTGDDDRVYICEGDCNEVLLRSVFPRARYEDFRRGLCLLDPYGLHLNWEVLHTAGHMGSIEVFLNFPVMDMNRNVLWRHPESADDTQIARMNSFWGDDSWRAAAYRAEQTLFGPEETKIPGNEAIAEAFRDRLKKVASFRCVPDPIPMRNSIGGIIYYLFFASHQPVAEHIVRDIFNKYRDCGA